MAIIRKKPNVYRHIVSHKYASCNFSGFSFLEINEKYSKDTLITRPRIFFKNRIPRRLTMVQEKDDPGCRHRSQLKLAGFLARSSVNGPGIRAVVWVQGCPLRCDGCFNPEFLPFSGGYPVRAGYLAEMILAIEGIDGVTFSGGEPFAQASALSELGAILKEAGMSVVTFTGFTWEQLTVKNRPTWSSLLSVTDILIAGPYVLENNPGMQRSTGSTCKYVIHLCDGKFVSGQRHNSWMNHRYGDEIEFTIQPDGRLVMTGFPGTRLVGELASLSSGK
jgi:anaerobic ribonucleoside-triphosphate reductase activating protein